MTICRRRNNFFGQLIPDPRSRNVECPIADFTFSVSDWQTVMFMYLQLWLAHSKIPIVHFCFVKFKQYTFYYNRSVSAVGLEIYYCMQSVTRWLYCAGCTQYSIRLEERSAICAQAVYFLHSTTPSVTWLHSRWWLSARDCLMPALSAVLSTRVGRHRKFGEVSCLECTGQGNWMTLNWFQR